jgi:hypothetical protein
MANRPRGYRKYNLLFTPELIPQLRNLRDEDWARLMDKLSALPETDPDVLAFAMMMIELGNCLACWRDSYRAQRGCARCARHTILTFKDSDEALFDHYEEARCKMYERLGVFELEQAA